MKQIHAPRPKGNIDYGDLAERAAIFEFEGGLSRAEAEAMAVGEYLDQSAGQLPGILGELIHADQRRRNPELQPILAELGLLNVLAPAWGFAAVIRDGNAYRPALPNEPGLTLGAIVPVSSVVEGLVDLVAQSLTTGRMLARRGIGDIVGLDEVERARQCETPLLVFGDVLSWLRSGCSGSVIIDWRDVSWRLQGVRTVLCHASIAPRLHAATRECLPMPTIAVPSANGEVSHAA